MNWELLAGGFGRLEAPCFDAEGRFCFVDRTPPGRVLRLEADGSTTELAQREHVGGLVAHAEGGLVASGHRVSVLAADGQERVVLDAGTGWGFNDLGTDEAGAVYVGRFDVDPLPPALGEGGSLWRIGGEEAPVRYYDGIKLTNGIAVSPDGCRLYHNDTGAKAVWVSDLDPAGAPLDRRVLHRFDEFGPDGLALDEEGGVWVALMGSGLIAHLLADGSVEQTIEGPSRWTSSICFDGTDLYAVTFGGAPYDPDRSGGVYRAAVGVAGAPVHPARV